ncbi:GDSL-type esterase/lipase family protein [Hymenobacter aerilatus]|uniref:GDSL-type esterase/lipase family protein n=1 Tax=Hymenobacter aerilatus TaxID=2932251 RepID=A0A8T9SY53_9BACT|nr:GDSL-type esterase/lipase family protein [Hymenobacter aerilatus]UOR06795.1 GDSL-type esterase/lipase family protein [Hymenobacter aerilatus]
MQQKLLVLLVVCLFSSTVGQAQQAPLDSLKALYPFLHPERNAIVNGEVGLRHFYKKLKQLPGPLTKQISIVHIGDSHLQADMASGRTRRELQRTYGNAGRGLIFPYAVARTNEPGSYRTASTARWQARRVISLADTTLPIGASGITLATTDSGASFTLQVPLVQLPDYRFNRLTLLHQKGPAAFDWQLTDEQQHLLGRLPGRAARLGSYTSSFTTDSLLHFVRLTTTRTNARQTSAQLYGLVLENGQPGVLYHAIGINGAAVRHYNRAELFATQLECLAPDLFIVSLGTNDAYAAGFDKAQFEVELTTFMQQLRQRYPQAEFLLTTPPDSYRNRRYRNPDLPVLRDILLRYCTDNKLAYWDFYAVMGGPGSMLTWQTHGLAQPDRVHLTPRGYHVQGLLLYLALQDGFLRATRP